MEKTTYSTDTTNYIPGANYSLTIMNQSWHFAGGDRDSPGSFSSVEKTTYSTDLNFWWRFKSGVGLSKC